MKKDIRNNIKWVTIAPGEYYATKEQPVITTLLGSCVAACLYDPVNGIVGMNHFLLSSRKQYHKGGMVATEAGRYGINSMELLINRMLSLGADRKFLKAKAFGGGNVLNLSRRSSDHFGVGETNAEFVKEYLENEKIPIISSALGGEIGRVIRFKTSDYTVFVKKIKKLEVLEIKTRELKYLEKVKKEIAEQEVTDSNVDLW